MTISNARFYLLDKIKLKYWRGAARERIDKIFALLFAHF